MKKIFKILLIVLLISGGVMTENQVKAQSVSVSLSVFQKSLSPYGRWMNNSKYGQVWIANDHNFVPYQTGGHWAYTDYGWTWVSDYDWGWAPFHYGRWNYERNTGWYWVPDYDWGPAWVAWRGGGDYYGWAPLSPGLDISVGVSYGNQIPEDRWVFAPHRYITSASINRYYVPRTRNVTIIKNTTIVNNVTIKNNVHVDAGPRREDVEKINRTKIKTYTVSNSSKPGKTVVNNTTVNVYRPVVNKTTVVNNNNTTVNKSTVNKNDNNKTVVNKNSNSKNVNKNSTTNRKVVNTQKNNTTVNKDVTNKPQPKPAINKQLNSSDKQTTLKKNEPVKPKLVVKPRPVVKPTNNNKPQVKKQPAQEKKNKPASGNKKNNKNK